jgi:hypothetical protein
VGAVGVESNKVDFVNVFSKYHQRLQTKFLDERTDGLFACVKKYISLLLYPIQNNSNIFYRFFQQQRSRMNGGTKHLSHCMKET